MFSVDDFNKNVTDAEALIIDSFFQSLRWDDLTSNPEVDLVTYGALMEMVDTNNRWVYKGSVTTPVCATFVYWNVLSTIYPVKAKHLQQFQEQLNRGENGRLDEFGNWREIQDVDYHDVIYIQSDQPVVEEVIVEEVEDYSQQVKIMTVAAAALAVVVLMLIAIVFVMKNRMTQLTL